MSLSVIIPVHNENKNIKKTINNLKKLKKYIKNFNILFIDDFSKDDTFELLKKYSKKYYFIKVFKNKKKRTRPCYRRRDQEIKIKLC